jgi:hypothetical protein
MNRLMLIVIIILLLLLGGAGFFITILQKKVENGKGYQSLYEQTLEENKIWKTKEGLWMNKASQAQATANNLRDQSRNGDPELAKLRQEFTEIRKNFNNVQNILLMATQRIDSFNTVLRDTVIVRDSIRIKAKHFVWSDGCHIFSEVLYNDTAFVVAQSVDSVDQVIYFTRKKFIGIGLGKKMYESEMISKCANTKIVYNKSISVKRRERIF